MTFILSKVFFFMIQPINWIIVMMLFALFYRNKGFGKYFFYAALGMLLVFSNPLILNTVYIWWEPNYRNLAIENEVYDGVIVLGGFSNQHASNQKMLMLNNRGARFTSGLAIYKEGFADKMIISGGSGAFFEDEAAEALVVKAYLVDILSLPETDIRAEPKSRNTFENAVFTKALIDEEFDEHSRFLLVTSAFHMQRAKGLFRKQGINVTPFPTDYIAVSRRTPTGSFLPSPECMSKWEIILKEWAGIIVYKLQGRL